ncbi:MAG: DUF3347 domain-containing protein [Bacteroidetes bacterium]|nr:DUF3347 domain-containing protein [Bacteroidota bacterium]
MKVLFIALIFVFSLSSFASATNTSYSIPDIGDTVAKSQLSQLLSCYYEIKDALINADAVAASNKAAAFVAACNGIDMKTLSTIESKIFTPLQNKLSLDARHISEVKNIEHQREHFAKLSDNMYALAKAVKLSSHPVYQDYCPMKKAHWLSNEIEIKNPYYGNQMLTCGSVTNTIK